MRGWSCLWWALDLFLKEYETRRADAVASFHRYISGMSYVESLRGQFNTCRSNTAPGHVFERQVLNFLALMPNASFRYVVEQMTWSYCGPIQRFDFLQDMGFQTHQSNSEQKATASGAFSSQLSGHWFDPL